VRRVLHITDVHFGRDHQPDRAAALVRLAGERRPDVVVVSGDVTKRAKPTQFADARRFVDSFGAPAVVVPGNHDVPLFRVWERALVPFGAYRRHFDRVLEPVWEDEELLIIGVNTAHAWTFTGGRVRRRQVRAVARRLREQKGRRFAIVVLHHQMIPVPGYGSNEVFRGARRMARALAEGRADLVLSGHVHLSHLGDSSAVDAAAVPAVPVLFSGTVSSSRGRGPERDRNTCHWLEVEERGLTVERLEWQGERERFRTVETRVLTRRARRE
jgi:3',5'-cyclic AMP phosphodiesterase CpdA